MIDGTYTAHFQSNMGDFGDGVVTVINKQISGGDSMYRYSGKLVEHGEILHAQIAVEHYAGNQSSIFGPLKSFQLELKGTIQNGIGRLSGWVKGHPQMKISIALKLVEQIAAE